jgi:peptidoglycan/LPS O-acetylase OafA/YrhL
MLSLDRSKNDTSMALDLLRAVAAQMVCVGHSINFSRSGFTLAPVWGVLIFFILSGFVIAYTLDSKSRDEGYNLVEFGIERIARIYSVYAPALLLIATMDWAVSGLFNYKALLGNLLMLQNVPNSGFTTYGTAGHLTSIAVEFHIYFFVGATFFLLRGRQRALCAAVLTIFATMPLAYTMNIAGTDRALFVLWLAGFALYFVLRAAALNGLGFWLILATAGATYFGKDFFNSNPYDLANYPLIVLSFACFVVVTQSINVLARFSHIIRFFAGYSLSLFLIHLTIVTHITKMWPARYDIAMAAIVVSNILAALFATVTERHYRALASRLKALAHSARPDGFSGRYRRSGPVSANDKIVNSTAGDADAAYRDR